MKRLCLFTDSLEPSGVGAHMLTLAARLRERYQIVLCCPPSSGGSRLLDRARAMGIETGRLTDSQVLMNFIKQPPTSASHVDIFHAHAGIGWESIAAIRFARDAGIPVVLRTEHLPYVLTDLDQQRRYERAIRLVDQVICVSDGVRETLRATGVPAGKLAVVCNGIDPSPSSANRGEVRDALGLPPGARLILTVGRFARQKGHRYLARAAASVLDREPNAHFLWVGDGPWGGRLRRQVRALGIADHVHFLGRRNDVPELLLAADLFVLPSLFEGLPLVVLEAMAAGVPVIGTRVCGTDEAIVDGVTGRLVPPRDSQSLAAAVLKALARPEVAAGWSTAARLRREREFSAARMVREVEAIYHECLEHAGPSSCESPGAGNESGSTVSRVGQVEPS